MQLPIFTAGCSIVILEPVPIQFTELWDMEITIPKKFIAIVISPTQVSGTQESVEMIGLRVVFITFFVIIYVSCFFFQVSSLFYATVRMSPGDPSQEVSPPPLSSCKKKKNVSLIAYSENLKYRLKFSYLSLEHLTA